MLSGALPLRVVTATVEQHSSRTGMRARRGCLSFTTLLFADILRQGVRNNKVQFDESVSASRAQVALCDTLRTRKRWLMGLATLASEMLASGIRASRVLTRRASRVLTPACMQELLGLVRAAK